MSEPTRDSENVAHRITRRRAPDSFMQPADSAACEDCAWTCVAAPRLATQAIYEHRRATRPDRSADA
jgi:hypothetical protein